MKSNLKNLGLSSLMVLATVGVTMTSFSASASPLACNAIMRGTNTSLPAEAQWRVNETISMIDAQGQAIQIKTDASREFRIRSSHDGLVGFIKGGDVPYMNMVAESGVQLSQTRAADYYHGDVYPTMDVTNLPKDAAGNMMFRATLLLPVSGHVSPKDTEDWSKTDSITVTVTDLATRQKTILVNDVLSMGYVSIADIQFPAAPGQKLHIEYSRRGKGQYSGTTSRGFMSGRNIELTIK